MVLQTGGWSAFVGCCALVVVLCLLGVVVYLLRLGLAVLRLFAFWGFAPCLVFGVGVGVLCFVGGFLAFVIVVGFAGFGGCCGW